MFPEGETTRSEIERNVNTGGAKPGPMNVTAGGWHNPSDSHFTESSSLEMFTDTHGVIVAVNFS